MMRYTPVLAILLVLGIHFLPSPTAAQSGYVEVTFRCPVTMGMLTFDWRNPLGGEYTEAGSRHALKFQLTGGSAAPNVYVIGGGPKRSGGGIRCDYSSANNASVLQASYFYDVHREIISCAADGSALTCKLKP